MTALDPYLKAIGRALLSILFFWGGYEKITGYAGAQAYMEQFGVPGVLLPLVIATELGGAIVIFLGWRTRLAAIALAGFCLLTAVFFHSEIGDMNQLINFLKNLGLAGGFLVLAASGPGALSLDER